MSLLLTLVKNISYADHGKCKSLPSFSAIINEKVNKVGHKTNKEITQKSVHLIYRGFRLQISIKTEQQISI